MLSVYLEPFERAIAFQVTNQDPKITDFIKRNGSFVASNGWTVTSQVAPELDIKRKIVYLRGSNSSKDKRVDRTWDLRSNSNRDEYISAANQALQELVNAASPVLFVTAGTSHSTPTGGPDTADKNRANEKPLIKQ